MDQGHGHRACTPRAAASSTTPWPCAAGFLVLAPSQFVIISQMGILVAVDMLTIALSALTFLPACTRFFLPNLASCETAPEPEAETPGMGERADARDQA
ncbi:MAG: MMPL family transporter [Candidatus Moduliflexus flocculans]|nr:MMPL family transporter [Candidatus Moduliflexus flocculans]